MVTIKNSLTLKIVSVELARYLPHFSSNLRWVEGGRWYEIDDVWKINFDNSSCYYKNILQIIHIYESVYLVRKDL